MWRLLRIGVLVGLLGFRVTTATAQTQTPPVIPVGTPAAEVVREFGAPKSKLTKVDREVYVYPTFEVTLQEGKVTKVTLRRVAPQAITNPASPPVAPSVAPESPKTAPPPPASPPSAKPEMPVTQVTILGVLIALWPFYLILALMFPLLKIVRYFLMLTKKSHRSAPTEEPEAEEITGDISGHVGGMNLSHTLLGQLEWKRFEQFISLYFQAKGLRIGRPPAESDAEIKFCLFRDKEAKPYGYVQCRTWNADAIDARAIRSFFGIMAADDIHEGVFVTSGDFAGEALDFAEANGITCVNGHDLVTYFHQLSPEHQQNILTQVTTGDYLTPTCPKCDLKLELRGEGTFWGCVNWPKCRTKIFVRKVR